MMSASQTIILILFGIGCVFMLYPIKNPILNKFLFAFFYVSLMLIVTLRPDSMADYEAYEGALRGFGGQRFEPGFFLIKQIASLLGNTVFLGFFLYAFISITLKFEYIWNNAITIWGSLIVYMSNILVAQDMIAIRAAVAAALFLFAIDFRVRQKRIAALIILIVATFFHYSALMCFAVLFINPRRHYRVIYVIALVVCHVLALYGIHLNQFFGLLSFTGVYDNLNSMYEGTKEMNVFNLLQIGHVFVCLAFWMNVKKIQRYDIHGIIYLKLYTIGVCAIPLFSEMIAVASRMSELFLTVEILLIPVGFLAMFKNQLYGKIVLLCYSMIIIFFTITNLQYWYPLLYELL